MNSFDLACAILSSAAYRFEVDTKNRIEPSPGATEIARTSDPGLLSGFEAQAYDYQGKIVIAYAGTNLSQVGDVVTNLALGLGGNGAQLRQAAEFYLSIKNNPAYAGKEIVLTGHSLGGGLAALMGVFFNERAVTFDPAPFRLAATQGNASALRSYLAWEHPEWPANGALLSFTTVEGLVGLSVPGLSLALAAALLPIKPELSLRVATLPFPITVRGESNIKAYSVTGEFLTNGYKGLASGDLNELRIQSASQPEFIAINPAGANIDGIDLHSMNLLIAAAQEPRLAALFNDNARLTEALFDKSLYARPSSCTESDLLARLLRREFGGVGTPASGTGILARLADDFDRYIAVAGGMAAQGAVQTRIDCRDVRVLLLQRPRRNYSALHYRRWWHPFRSLQHCSSADQPEEPATAGRSDAAFPQSRRVGYCWLQT